MPFGTRNIRAPRGTALTCKGWPQEAALRMLMNNRDPDGAERPDDLVVYGGSGNAARNWMNGAAALIVEVEAASRRSMARHVEAMLALQQRGAVTFDYGNNIRAQAQRAGVENAFDIPGFVPEYVRPLFCEGKGPFRWAALSGDPDDIAVTDEAALEMFADDAPLCRWIRLARERVAFQGLPARICWLGYGDRARFGLRINELVRQGRVTAPIVIGRDHLDTGSVASPNRETEAMRDGSDAIADWPVLNALLNASAGATWVSVHHGGGVGIGYSLHAGMVIVADGTRDADERLRARADLRPGDWRRRGMPTPATRKRSDGRPPRHRMPMRRRSMSARGSGEMTGSQPGFDRRVQGALDAAPSRIPVVLGGCGTGRTWLLQRLQERPGHGAAQYIDVDGVRPRRNASFRRSPAPRRSPGRRASGRRPPRAKRSMRCSPSSAAPAPLAANPAPSCSMKSSSSGRSKASRASPRAARSAPRPRRKP